MRHKLLFFSVLLELVLCGGAAIAWGGHTDAAHAASPTTLVKAGVFAKKTSTGLQSVTGLGFKPKLLILFGVAETADGFAAGYQNAFGASDAHGNSYAIAGWSWDARGGLGSDTDRRQTAKAITYVTTVGACVAEADLVSFDPDGFTLDWTTNDSNAWVIHYLALGGEYFDSKVSQFTATAGTQSYTHVGFKSDLLLFFGTPSVGGPLSASFGFADGAGNQFALGVGSQNSGTTPTETGRYQRSDKCFVAVNSYHTMAIKSEASLVSIDPSGFTLNLTGDTITIISVAIVGVHAKVGVLTSPGSSGSQGVTGAGFSPRGALFAGFNRAASTSLQDDNRYTVGIADAVGGGRSMWVGDTDNISNDTHTDMASYDDYCYISADADSPITYQSRASLSSFDADGFTLSWYIFADSPQQVGYLLIGDYPSGPVAPVGGIAEPPEATLGGASGKAVPLPMVAGLLGVAGAMLAGALGAWRVYSVRRR